MAGRVTKLRSLLSSHNLWACIIPSEDAHDSEMVAERDKRREFISGFTGSAGTAVISHSEALMWTDGRYWLQSVQQMDSSVWKLMKQMPGSPTIEQWIEKNAPKDSRIWIDGRYSSFQYIQKLSNSLMDQVTIVSTLPRNLNLIDEIWGSEQPSMPSNPIVPFRYPEEGKVTAVRKRMSQSDCKLLVICALDEIAWLLDLRSSDIPCNPVFFAYAFLTLDKLYLFVDSARLKSPLRDVEIRDYNDAFATLPQIIQNLPDGIKDVWIPSSCSYSLGDLIPTKRRKVATSPVASIKAVKSPLEIKNMRLAHVKDGVALCEFLYWLETAGVGTATETSAAAKVDDLRSKQEGFLSLSFNSISAVGPHAAIIHFSPEAGPNDLLLHDGCLYLIDSGGQYWEGTTDVTRTVYLGSGQPSEQMIEAFTRILKGHIALATLVFPSGTPGYRVDSFARAALWEVGLDYAHGTGHGVGMCLNVHEGPQLISYRVSKDGEAANITAGIIMSNEPGYYKESHFGIRLESLVVFKNKSTKYGCEENWLQSDTITMAPIQLKLIDKSLLNQKEIDWLNYYHQTVLSVLKPELISQNKSDVLQWLEKQCIPI